MVKKRIILIIFVLIIIFGIILFNVENVKYPTDDCIVFFDEEARYQIVDVGYEFHLLDASVGKSIFSNIKYYKFIDNELYIIFDKYKSEDSYEKYYGFLDIESESVEESDNYSDFGGSFEYDESKMIKLTQTKSKWLKWLHSVLPNNLRKSDKNGRTLFIILFGGKS